LTEKPPDGRDFMKPRTRRADKRGMTAQSPDARRAYRTALSPFAFAGAGFGIAHLVAETLAMVMWDVAPVWSDMLLGAMLYALVGLAGGVAVWAAGALMQRLAPNLAHWQSCTVQRQWCWLGLIALHSVVGWHLLWHRAAGAWWFAMSLLILFGAAVLIALGWRQTSSTARLAALALALCLTGITATTLPQIAFDLPTTGRIFLAAAAMLALPMAVPLYVSIRPIPAPTTTAAPCKRAIRPAAYSVTGAALIGMTLHGSIARRSFDWHVRQKEVAAAAPQTRAPNVLLIVLDTVRADYLDLFGYPRQTMPALTAFARNECDVARTILATAPSTLPTHASMFTGHYSHVHGAHQPFLIDNEKRPDYGYPLRDDLPTLAEHLTGLGFQTTGIAANYGVLSSYGLDRGFAHYDVAPGAAFRAEQLSWIHASRLARGSIGKLVRLNLPEALSRRTQLYNRWAPPYRRAAEMTDRCVDWLDQRDDRPFFLFVNYFDAHDPYVPPDATRQRFAPPGVHVDWAGFIPHADFLRVMHGEGTIPNEWCDYLVSQYDAELAYLDGELARLLSHLRDANILDNTLLVITSDHGEAFLEHGLLRHGTSLYESQVRVPLIVRFPRSMQPPPTIAENFQFVDIYPSIMAMIGAQPPDDLAGTPWGHSRDHALSEVFVHEPDIDRLRRELVAVERNGHKFIQSTTGRRELYKPADDPAEQRDLVGNKPETESAAHAIIDARNAKLVRQLQATSEDAALQQKLRSLGYIR